MKKIIIFTSLAVAFVMGLLFTEPMNIKKSAQMEKTNAEKANYNYILSDYNGYIALFEASNNEPIEVYNILTDSLPSNDILTIKNGIYANTVDELNLIIEEYTS